MAGHLAMIFTPSDHLQGSSGLEGYSSAPTSAHMNKKHKQRTPLISLVILVVAALLAATAGPTAASKPRPWKAKGIGYGYSYKAGPKYKHWSRKKPRPRPTASPTPTATTTPTASPTPTVTTTPTASPTPTVTTTPTPTTTPTVTASPTPTVTTTPTPTTTPTVTASPTPTVTTSPPTKAALPDFGVQFHGMWGSYTDTERAAVLDTLKKNGTTTVRLDVSWAMLQPSGPTFDTWGTNFVTRVLKMITDRGMDPLVMIWMTPQWVTGSSDTLVPPTTSTQLNHWQNFLQQAAAKFPQVTHWEIWNEANSDDFMRGGSASVYAQVLARGYAGIKAGNPNAKVIFAGPQYVDTPWVVSALNAGAKGKYDIMGVHPYMAVGNLSPDTPDDGTIWRMRHLPTLRNAMLAVGDNKPMWFTEFGWRVGNSGTANWQLGVSEATQAQYLAKTLSMIKNEWPYVTRVYWYRERVEGNVNIAGYGLIRTDGTARPALTQIPSIYATP
jgi:hypothetical protein